MVKTVFVDELDGANARSQGLTIWIKRGIKCIAAVWAQEYFEVYYRLSHPFGVLFSRNKTFREMELQSHEIETQAAVEYYEMDEEAYRLKEAKDMKKGYNWFYGMSVKEITESMLQRKHSALEWIHKNRKAVENFKSSAERD
jgi:hypothetical protein